MAAAEKLLMGVTEWSRREDDPVEEGLEADEHGRRGQEEDDPHGITHWNEDIAVDTHRFLKGIKRITGGVRWT